MKSFSTCAITKIIAMAVNVLALNMITAATIHSQAVPPIYKREEGGAAGGF